MTTFFGKTVTVSAERQLHVGDTMSNFTLMSSDLTLKSLSDFEGGDVGTRRMIHGDLWSIGWHVEDDGCRAVIIFNEDQITRWISFYEWLVLNGTTERSPVITQFLGALYTIKGFMRMHKNAGGKISL